MKKLLHPILIVIAIIILIVAVGYIKQDSNLGGTLPVAGSTYNLYGAGISSSATSITLQKLTLPQTGQKLVDGNFSDTFYLTVEPGNKTRQEIVACTTVTQNGDGTATLSDCSRGMAPISPYTASTTLSFSHAGGSQVIFSDPPQLFNEFAAWSNTGNITNTWNFTVTPTSSDTCTAATEFCTKSYIDAGVNQGAATSTEIVGGISELATQNEMASSTVWGITKPHVIQSVYATSTPSDQSTGEDHYVVVTEDDLKINQLFLDLTEAYTFSGNMTFNTGILTMADATITSELIVGTGPGLAPTSTLSVWGNTYFQGNSTSTGSFALGGDFCPMDKSCIPNDYNGLYYASTTDTLFAAGVNYPMLNKTTPAINKGDTIHVIGSTGVANGSGDATVALKIGSATTTVYAFTNTDQWAIWDFYITRINGDNSVILTGVSDHITAATHEATITSSDHYYWNLSTSTSVFNLDSGVNIQIVNGSGSSMNLGSTTLMFEIMRGFSSE